MMRKAWAHTFPARQDGVSVAVIAPGDVTAVYPGERQVVKVDVEGAECETLATTPRDTLEGAEELVAEAHGDAACRAACRTCGLGDQ